MILNTDLFNKDSKVAVQCQSEHDARLFLDAAISEFENPYRFDGQEWHVYGDKTAYGFYHGKLLHFSDTDTLDEMGYQIADAMSVLFSTKVDEIETDESLSVYDLFCEEVHQ